jgi:hypothetical protein
MMRYHGNRLGRIAGVVALAAALGLTGCDLDKLLEVNDPETVNPATLEDPTVIEVVIAGAEGDFGSAFGGGDSWITVDPLIADQFISSGSFPTRTATDQRIQWRPSEGNTSDDIYVDLQFARRALREAAERVAAHEDYGTSSEAYQETKALEGYTMVLLGEGFCSAVPLSYVDEGGEFVYAEPSTSQEVLQAAIAAFDQAGSHPLAAVGKARALLAMGQYSQAASEVSGIPTTWERYIYFSQTGINNPIYSLQGNGRYSQSHNEGINGQPYLNGCEVPLSEGGIDEGDLDWDGIGPAGCDPRSPWWEDPAGGFTPTIPLYRSLKYTDYDSPVVLASGVEARLIEAEAALENSDYAGMTGILNGLRQSADAILSDWIPDWENFANWALPDLAVPGDRAAAIDQLFSERGFWLFLSGHRLGDLRRMVYQKGMNSEAVYPTAGYHKGGAQYGPDVVFPLDFDEGANPNFSHDQCDVESAGITG